MGKQVAGEFRELHAEWFAYNLETAGAPFLLDTFEDTRAADLVSVGLPDSHPMRAE